MLRSDFNFELPHSQIAQTPLDRRDASRLLYLSAKADQAQDMQFLDLPGFLRPGDLLVMNDTRVIPARLYGHKQTGGRIEILLERLLDDSRCLAQIRASKSPRQGSIIQLDEGHQLMVIGRHDDLFELIRVGDGPLLAMFEEIGHVPLPPYIQREDGPSDHNRYQTVYAQRPGAVAAPTAGLHFDDTMLECLQAKGINRVSITLHVGAGTFQPLRSERVADNKLHSEYIEVSDEVVAAIESAKASGGRVVAIGTTSVRALESAAADGEFKATQGDTNIFIYPGYKFKVVDALLTNFHLPESSLLMLVCAFGGYDRVMAAYQHAVQKGYRFFSYGDAMFLEPRGA